MSQYKAVLADSGRSLAMVGAMLHHDLRVAELRRAVAWMRRERAADQGKEVEYDRYGREVDARDAEIRRRLADMMDETRRVGGMLVATFGLDGGAHFPRPDPEPTDPGARDAPADGDTFEPYADWSPGPRESPDAS